MNRVSGTAKVAPMIGMRSQNPEDGVSRTDATGYNWTSSQDSSVRGCGERLTGWGKKTRRGEAVPMWTLGILMRTAEGKEREVGGANFDAMVEVVKRF